MPFVIGEYERHLLQLGVIVATHPGRSWKCWHCDIGQLLLTRDVNAKGEPSAAKFVCNRSPVCEGADVSIYPDKGGSVQPALKGMKKAEAHAPSYSKASSTNDTTGGWQ